MNQRVQQVGFSQRVRLAWLERTAGLALAGNDEASIAAALQELLKEEISVGGTAERGNRAKVITILMRVWVKPPQPLRALRADGLELLARLPADQHLAVHWGMVMAVYPFWGNVAAQVGRLLRLQGHAVAAQVQRRLREQYGERETIARAARRVLRSFIDWGVLTETGTPGVYASGVSLALRDPGLIVWLTEVVLHAQAALTLPLRQVLDAPSLFPFQLGLAGMEELLSDSSRLEVVLHGMDQVLVRLK